MYSSCINAIIYCVACGVFLLNFLGGVYVIHSTRYIIFY